MKKVLISWEELDKARYTNQIDGLSLMEWFDAQPDVTDMVASYEASKRIMARALENLDASAVLSKMETTGGEE